MPKLFEFTDSLLLFIAKELNRGRFGTFLGNNQRDRKALKVRDMTESIWTYILIHKDKFTNKHYDAEHSQKIFSVERIECTSYEQLDVWRAYFFQWTRLGNCEDGETPLGPGTTTDEMGVRSSAKRDEMHSILQRTPDHNASAASVNTEANRFRSETEQEEYVQYKMEARRSVHAHKQISKARGRRSGACGFCCCR